MSGMKIAVVNSSTFGRVFPEHIRALRRLGTVARHELPPRMAGAALARRLGDPEVVVSSVNPLYDEDFFARSPRLVLLTRHGIGYNNVDVRAAARSGVIVSRVPGPVEREAMAEHAVALILATCRKLFPAAAAVRAGKWARRMDFVGVELKGRTVGLVGCGNIGSRVAEILSLGFGSRVLACDPEVSAFAMRRYGAEKTSLTAVLRESDAVSLHASLNPTSRGLIGRRELAAMRPGAVLVNNARGELLDEPAVRRALRSGKLGGVGLDVVAREPAGADHPLLKCPGAVIVPHIGAYTRESLKMMGDKVVDDVAHAAKRRAPPREVVNPEVFKSEALRW
jgi:phosphoglycerate dehydrogenase-like enzyme